jgi:hypothetical protein
MEVNLSPSYRAWMVALLPATFGIGTTALWVRSLRWPRTVDVRQGITLRYRRQLPWDAITKIRVVQSYLDGHVLRLEIHYRGGICKIPIHAIRDGENVARTIIASFRRKRRSASSVTTVASEAQLHSAEIVRSRLFNFTDRKCLFTNLRSSSLREQEAVDELAHK